MNQIDNIFNNMLEKSQMIMDALNDMGDDIKISTAESCTGGLIASAFTNISGASKIYDTGFVVYSNHAKINLLGVDPNIILEYSAVSPEVTIAMAQGAIKNSKATIAIATSGYAEDGEEVPSGDAGKIFIAVNYKNHFSCLPYYFNGNRQEVIFSASQKALDILYNFISNFHHIVN